MKIKIEADLKGSTGGVLLTLSNALKQPATVELLKSLQQGDSFKMDGATGIIKITKDHD